MPRNEQKDKLQRDERRSQIFEAAVRAFSRKGVSANMHSIAAEAGLSHSHIYNYFRSKEELLLSIATKSQDNYSNVLKEAQRRSGTAIERLLFVLNHFLRFDKADYYLILLQIQFSDVLPEEDKNTLKEKALSNLALLTEFIEEGQRQGLIREGNAKELATLFTNLMMSMVLYDMRGFDHPSQDTVELIMRMFGTGNVEGCFQKND